MFCVTWGRLGLCFVCHLRAAQLLPEQGDHVSWVTQGGLGLHLLSQCGC